MSYISSTTRAEAKRYQKIKKQKKHYDRARAWEADPARKPIQRHPAVYSNPDWSKLYE